MIPEEGQWHEFNGKTNETYSLYPTSRHMFPIKPHLWFDHGKAKEAAEFYTSLLPDSSILSVKQLQNMPAGTCEVTEFLVAGYPFMAIGAGQSQPFTPSISFMINFDPSRDPDAARHLDEVWNKLIEGGKALMQLDRYPFSERYGWLSDKYGLSWQLILTNPAGEERPMIIPSLMFTQNVYGKADEALDFYCSLFQDSKRGTTAQYPTEMGPDTQGKLMFADFYIDHTWLAAMDGAGPHQFGFNEAVSLLISCETQAEIDYYWAALSANGQAEQCGWLKDRYGVSWQISSAFMTEAIKTGSQEQIDRMTQAFMKMEKVDIATLQQAYNGN